MKIQKTPPRIDSISFPPNSPISFIENIINQESQSATLIDAINEQEDDIKLNTENITINAGKIGDLEIRVTFTEEQILKILKDYVSKSFIGEQKLNSSLDIGSYLKIDGAQVVSKRENGWFPCSGVGNKGGIDADIQYPISSTFIKGEVEALSIGLVQVRKLVKSMQDMMEYHGLIGQ